MRRNAIRGPARAVLISLTASAVIAGAALVPGSPALAAVGDWPQVGGDPGWSAYQPATGGLGARRASRLGLDWSATIPGGPTSAVLATGRLYVATSAGTVEVYDAVTGHRSGRIRIEDPRQIHQLAIVDRTLYVRTSGLGTDRNYLAAYTLQGQRRWQFELPRANGVSPFTVDGGRIALNVGPTCHDPCAAYDLWTFDAATGQLLWRVPTGGDARFLAPAFGGASLYQPTEVPVRGHESRRMLLAFDAGTGQLRWSRPAGFGVAVRAGAVYTEGTDGLCSYRATSGAPRWCLPSQGRTFDTIGLGPSLALTTNATAPELIGVDTATGHVRWWTSFAEDAYRAEVSVPPVLGNGVGYGLIEHYTEDNDRIRAEVGAVDTRSGAILRRVTLPAGIGVALQLVLGEGHVFVVTDAGVFALD
jgi:outer membrane protein assembly factor BamB